MARKALNCTEEDFYLMVQLVCGPPRPAHFTYQGATQWAVGVQAWCLNTEEGQRFTQCVTNCGEAKTRAGVWYKNYRNWWLKQNKVSYQQWVKEMR